MVIETTIQIRTQPWSGDYSNHLADKQRRINEANLLRPRFHQKQMATEELHQRRVESALAAREAASGWLKERVREGRMELLVRRRSTGVEREARMLWSQRACTLPGIDCNLLAKELTIS